MSVSIDLTKSELHLIEYALDLLEFEWIDEGGHDDDIMEICVLLGKITELQKGKLEGKTNDT
jgi:hypothetical protein